MKDNNLRRTITAAICIFVLTITVARTISFYWPRFHLDLYPGVRIHHYVYGIFLLTVAGYLALLFKGPRATAWIACMYGLGVGLTFDEFGFWMNLNGRGVRWHTGGLTLVGILFFVSIATPVIYGKVRKEIQGLTETRAKARDYEVSNNISGNPYG
jgi:hypothetical protein